MSSIGAGWTVLVTDDGGDLRGGRGGGGAWYLVEEEVEAEEPAMGLLGDVVGAK